MKPVTKKKTVKVQLGKDKLDLFTIKQFTYLHKVFLQENQDSKTGENIKKKKGINLEENEINFVKDCFAKYIESKGGYSLE